MEATQSHLDQILDEIASLSLDEQEMLINIIKKRNIEQKRRADFKRIPGKPKRAIRKGLTKRGTVEDLIKDLESD